jgi:hypothetical protein
METCRCVRACQPPWLGAVGQRWLPGPNSPSVGEQWAPNGPAPARRHTGIAFPTTTSTVAVESQMLATRAWASQEAALRSSFGSDRGLLGSHRLSGKRPAKHVLYGVAA